MTYLVEMGRERDDAFQARQQAIDDGWRTSLYADGSGWVVRLNRVAALGPHLLTRDQRYVEALAQAFGGVVRGFTVEPIDADDPWGRLAARLSDASTTAERAGHDALVRHRKTSRSVPSRRATAS